MLDLSALELDDEKKPAVTTVHEGDVINNLPVTDITPGRYQPRREFDETALNEMAESIRTHGVMQPVVVRRVEHGFELIAGERRWRATQLAGLPTIPAIIREIDDKNALAIAVVENIQRQNLLPMEEAQALQRLKQEFKLKNKEVAKIVGKPENDVNKLLTLLKLADPIAELYSKGLHGVEVLIELNRAYDENAGATVSFIDGKDDITLREVRAFRSSLKGEPEEKNSSTSFFDSGAESAPIERAGEGAGSNGSTGSAIVRELEGETETPAPTESGKEFEIDNGELTSFPRGKAIADPDRLKKPLLLVDYEGRVAAILLNRKPKSPGVVFIRYEDGGGDEMVSVDKLKIIQLSEE